MNNRSQELKNYLVPGAHVHLVGIGGVSMRPLGLVLKGMGMQVSGSDMNLNDGVQEKITYLTRKDWEGTMPSDEILKLTLTKYLKEALQDVQYDPADYSTVEMPVLGADNGLKLVDMIGLDYNDPKWELLLDQMTFEEMDKFFSDIADAMGH